MHLLQRPTPEMVGTSTYGWIHSQCCCPLGYQQTPLLPNHGIQILILPTSWKNLSSSSQAATEPDWGHMTGSEGHSQTHTTTNERTNLLPLQTLESWWQDLAWKQKSQASGILQKTFCQTNRPLQNCTSCILHSLQLKLPKQWKIHDVFHTFLLSSYREILEYSSNFPQPPLKFIGTKKEYKIFILLIFDKSSLCYWIADWYSLQFSHSCLYCLLIHYILFHNILWYFMDYPLYWRTSTHIQYGLLVYKPRVFILIQKQFFHLFFHHSS